MVENSAKCELSYKDKVVPALEQSQCNCIYLQNCFINLNEIFLYINAIK